MGNFNEPAIVQAYITTCQNQHKYQNNIQNHIQNHIYNKQSQIESNIKNSYTYNKLSTIHGRSKKGAGRSK